MHENAVNGKKYIGITCQKPERRWSNGRGYAHNTMFFASIQKYGWDNFRHYILYTDLSQEEAERLEVELIAKHDTLNRAKGYNLDPGGCVRHPTDETREKLRQAHTGYIMPQDQREKIRAANLGKHKPHGRPAWNRGKSPSNETRRRLSESHLGQVNANRRAVICITTGETYKSATEAARVCGIDRSNISAACRGVKKTAGGRIWKYAE